MSIMREMTSANCPSASAGSQTPKTDSRLCQDTIPILSSSSQVHRVSSGCVGSRATRAKSHSITECADKPATDLLEIFANICPAADLVRARLALMS